MTTAEEAEDLTPRNDAERDEAARAVHEARRRAEANALIQSLTDRERILIEEAWARGARSARDDLASRLANPQAATLDANAVADVIRTWRDTPDVFHLPHPTWPHDPRVIQMVHVALRSLPDSTEQQPHPQPGGRPIP